MRVSVRTDAGQYAANFHAKAEELLKGVRACGRKVERVALERADWWSSGPYKQKQLDRMDHPYARRRSFKATTKSGREVTRYQQRIGQGFPARINVQTGKFKAGWKVRRTSNQHEMQVVLYNTSDRTPYLTVLGTQRMIGRPVLNRIARDVRQRTKGLYAQMAHKAYQAKAPGVSGLDLRGAFRRGFRLGTALTP